MAEPPKPVLQKPPGYRDPNAPVRLAPKLGLRKPILPSTFPVKRRRRSCCRICCCFFCIFSFILIIILFLGGAFFYLWFNPKVPVFHLQSLKIQRFNVTVKSDATYIDSQTAVKVEVRNPNDKITFRYGKTSVTLTAGLGEDETELGSGSSGEFTQGKKSTTVVKWTVHEKNVLVADEVGAKLKARYRSRAMVVSVVVRTRVSLGVGGWRIGTVGMHISCGDVALKKLDGGDMPKCTVNVLKWINFH